MTGIQLIIDYRERSLVSRLSNYIKEKDLETRNLDIGDIHFVEKQENGSESTRLILERKTLKDLASSIKDGRYVEQKKRLVSFRQMNPNTNIGYILEGQYSFDPRFICSNIGNRSLSGVVINSVMRDGFQFWFMSNEQETEYFIVNLFERFSQDPKKYFPQIPQQLRPDIAKNVFNDVQDSKQGESDDRLMADYVHAAISSFNGVHTKKKDNMDVKLCFIIQLSCIPGVSGKKAQEIVDKLNIKSIFELGTLLKQEEENNNDKPNKKSHQNLLQNISGIGPKLAQTIKKFILAS